jgi:hypothetical protein
MRKLHLATVALSLLLVSMLTALQFVEVARASSLETRSLDCLKAVLPIDFSHYSMSLNGTTPVEYTFSSDESVFLTVFQWQYQDQVLDTIDLRVLSGSIIPSRSYSNITDAAADFLLRYSTFTGGNMSALIRILSLLNETEIAAGTTAILGNLHLDAGKLVIPDIVDSTSFHWTYGSDNSSVVLSFDNGIFYSFQDRSHFSVQDNADAMSTAFPTPKPVLPTSEPSLSPSSTLEPASTPEPSTTINIGDTGTTPSPIDLYATVAFLVIPVVAGLSAICFKKHRK